MALIGNPLSQGPASVGVVSAAPWEDQVSKLISELLGVIDIEEAFCGFIVRSDENEQNKKTGALLSFKQFWNSQNTSLSSDEQDKVLKLFVQLASAQRNQRRGEFLFQLLDGMVEGGFITARSACDALLQNEKLHYTNTHIWSLTFVMLRKHIGGVDYKGCRDFLRAILELAQQIPAVENVSVIKQLDILAEVVSYLLDRNACLLPAYFSVNEITKMWSKDRPCPHWKLSQKLARFVQSFRPVAQMVTSIGRSQFLPVVGHSTLTSNVWKLQSVGPAALTFTYQGPLPYKESLYEPQTRLLRFVLEQPYSRDMVSLMLSLNKTQKVRCMALEDQLVESLIDAMKQTAVADAAGSDINKEGDLQSRLMWQHLGAQLIHFVLFQFTSFPHMVNAIYKKVESILKVEEEVVSSQKNPNNSPPSIRAGREHLMWVLLQFISGSIQKNMLADFLPVLRLYDLLYPEMEAIPVPDISLCKSATSMAITCIWIHLQRKAQTDQIRLQRAIPPALKNHLDFLQSFAKKSGKLSLPTTDYRICLLCNAYSTNPDVFTTPMSHLIKTIFDTAKPNLQMPGPGSDVSQASQCLASSPSQPLSMALLDSLTVHAKMSLIHGIVTKVMGMGTQGKTNVALSPALVETYSRLLVYTEIESLGIKGFVSQVLPKISSYQAWGILHTLIEILSYKFHHLGPHYRSQLLNQLHQLSNMQQPNLNQLFMCVESTALR